MNSKRELSIDVVHEQLISTIYEQSISPVDDTMAEELIVNLFSFIHNGGIQKLLYRPHLKMVLIFFVTKVFQKGTIF